jgi:hypothetical protein
MAAETLERRLDLRCSSSQMNPAHSSRQKLQPKTGPSATAKPGSGEHFFRNPQ